MTHGTRSLVLAGETNFVSQSVTREIALVFCLFYSNLASAFRHNEQHKERQQKHPYLSMVKEVSDIVFIYIKFQVHFTREDAFVV